MFDQGRIEEFIEGTTMTYHQMTSKLYSNKIAKMMKKLHLNTKMNHNDIHFNNIIVKPDKSIFLLDFEFSSEINIAYDIANHFNEWMYKYENDWYNYDKKLFPNKQQQIEFCKNYLSTNSIKDIEKLLYSVHESLIISHKFWIDWGIKTLKESDDLKKNIYKIDYYYAPINI